MVRTTLYFYERYVQRFARFQADHPELPLLDQVRQFADALPPSCRRSSLQALKWAFPDSVPWHKVRLPAYRRNLARLRATLLTLEERVRLLASLETAREKALVHVLWMLRRCEVAAFCWEQWERESGLISVVHGKGGQAKVTLLPPEAQAALAAWHRACGEPAEGWVFPSPYTGKPVTPDTIGQWVHDLLRIARIKKPWRGCHAFRRTFATEFLRVNKEDLAGLKELMRHEKLATTTEYLYLQPADLAPRLAKMVLFSGNGDGGPHGEGRT